MTKTSQLFGVKNIIIAVLLGIIAYQYRSQRQSHERARFTKNVASTINLESTDINTKLEEHTKLFNKKEVIKVNDQVYVGIGYGLANSIIIEGDTSYIVVDTLESIEGASEFRNDFNKLYNNSGNSKGKTVSHIVFTHYHADHTQGTTAFYDDEDNPPVIISHALTKHGLHRVNSVASSIVYTRAMRQFGTLTKEYDSIKQGNDTSHYDATKRLHINSGIGPELMVGDKWEKSVLLPTKTLHENFNRLTIDGIILDIYYAPGETDDQIFLYLPQSRTLLPADNIYETFPNLYAIRGSPTRDAHKWVESLDTMRYLYRRDDKWMNDPKNAENVKNFKGHIGYIEYMVPCHTRPVYGSQKIFDLLTVYRDGIQYIHDQTLRFTNLGLTPNEMVPIIKSNMPARLKEHPWLIEFYGTFDWSIRGVFNSYLGWFSGDAADLFPLSKADTANYLIRMFSEFANDNDNNNNNNDGSGAGNQDIIEFMLETAHDKIANHKTSEDCQWGLDVATNIMSLKNDLTYNRDENLRNENYIKLSNEQYEQSRNVRINGLRCMAGYQISANGRNYYLTSALEDSGKFRIKPSKQTIDKTIMVINLDFVFDSMAVRYKMNEVNENYKNSTFCYIFDITNDKLDRASDIPEQADEMNKRVNEEKAIYSWYKIELRDGIVEIIKGSDLLRKETSKTGWLLSKEECMDASETVMQMKSDIYREIVAGTRRNEAVLYAAGELKVLKGSVLNTKTFSGFFERN